MTELQRPNSTKFLSTNQPIWTYNTTNKWNNYWCVVDVRERLQKENIEYQHTYYVKFPQKQKVSVEMHGAFKYQNNLVASKKVKPWHELRVWNSFLLKYRRPTITCQHYFNLEAKQGRLVYHPVCQKIIYKAHPAQQKTVPAQRQQLPFRNTSV
uniref:Lipocalin n=1 Tax=Rhipicephalus zambeziensis TaxID=60191 RepID=A0A224YC90_9ACAR